MMTSKINGRVFHQYLVLRDNGVINIGSYLRVLAPHQIDRNMQGITLIRTYYPAVALCPPIYLSAARVNTDMEGTKSLTAILNNCHVAINQTSPIQTTCSSNFCDKQQPHDWTRGNRGCGCWGVTGLICSNIALMHTVVASDGVGVQVFNAEIFIDMF